MRAVLPTPVTHVWLCYMGLLWMKRQHPQPGSSAALDMFWRLIIRQFVLAHLYSMSWRHPEMVPIDVLGFKPPFPLDWFAMMLSSSRPGVEVLEAALVPRGDSC